MRLIIRILIPTLMIGTWCATAAEVPRPEFPEPQFQRELWRSLNGSWEFEFDDANAGLKGHWATGSNKGFSKTISVPFCFESKLSGIGDTSFHPWVWYRRAFTISPDWKSRTVLLHFGAVDYRAKVWLNGRMLGEHEGGNVPFAFNVTPELTEGTNVLVVRAEDPPEDRSIPRGKQYWEPHSASIFYTRTSGIWQPVWLEATGDSYLQRVKVTPTVDGTVRFEAEADSVGQALEFSATVEMAGKRVASASAKLAQGRATAIAVVADPLLWSPGSPNLYEVVFDLRKEGITVDRVHSYFGFRAIDVANGRIVLNGRTTFLKMVLDQGYWPDSILTPPTEEAIQYDIKMTLAMGFNGVRKHQKLEDPRYLYWADKLGLLVSSEMANAYVFNDAYVSRFTREWTEAVLRDYNHPSIIIWVPVNESWGVPDLMHDARQAEHLKSLYALTHSLDSTRLVIDNDGWEHTDKTDLFAIHDYTPNGPGLAARYKDLGKTGAGVPNNARAALVPGYLYNGSPVVLSEFGGIAFIPPDAKVPAAAWGYSGVQKSVDAALERLRSLYKGIAGTPGFAGLCYTQLTDVEQEVNGLMTYDRKPKFDAGAVREINSLVR